MKLFYAFFLLLNSHFALSGGGGSGGDISDLLYPAINFTILLVCLTLALKNPLKVMFLQNAEKIQDLYEYAEKRDKEANIKLDMFKKKMNNLEVEKSKIIQNAEKETSDFLEKTLRESEDYLKRLERDTNKKLQFERYSLENQMKEDLVNEVIIAAKSKLNSDKGLSSKATNKMISQI